MYAFSRGKVFILTSNSTNEFELSVSYHPFEENEIVCNVFDLNNDCQKIQNGNFKIATDNGQSKIYTVKKESSIITQDY